MSASNPSRSSSGFVSGRSSDQENENGGRRQSLQSSRRSSTSTTDETESVLSDTYKSFIGNHVKPYTKDYDALATSYLSTDLPFDRIICEDSNSYKDIPCPFPNPVPIESFIIQERSRQTMGPSLRKSRIIPTTQWIWNDLQCKMSLLTDAGERIEYLYEKARQWCDVNKALSMDLKYPKPDPNSMRVKHSKSHQRAVRLARRDIGISKKEPVYKCGPIIPFTKQFILSVLQPGSNTCGTSYDAGGKVNNEEQLEKWSKWAESVGNIFEDIQPLEELQTKETHWQETAIKSTDFRSKLIPKRKRFWKHNIYPPMTMEDHIRNKRVLLPPLKPENLQTDYLSGIWVPELMNKEFEITPLHYDSRIPEKDGEVEEPDPISWWVSHEAKQKCWQWLNKIPSTL